MTLVAAMVLSAGLGTRLQPLTSWRAKPLVPVGDRPAVGHIVAQLRAVSDRIVINAHHRAEDVESYAREEGLLVSCEPELLGTGGGVNRAADLLGEGDVLVWNGDMLGQLDAAALLGARALDAARGSLATLVVRPRPDLSGNVGLDAMDAVVRLRRETCRAGEARSADFLGIYVLGGDLRHALPPEGDIIERTFLPALHRGALVTVFACDAPFIDIGTPAAYLDANLRWLGSRASWVGSGARIDPRATLARTVVGPGASVAGAGSLDECVVWPGARASAPMTRAILAPEGTCFL